MAESVEFNQTIAVLNKVTPSPKGLMKLVPDFLRRKTENLPLKDLEQLKNTSVEFPEAIKKRNFYSVRSSVSSTDDLTGYLLKTLNDNSESRMSKEDVVKKFGENDAAELEEIRSKENLEMVGINMSYFLPGSEVDTYKLLSNYLEQDKLQAAAALCLDRARKKYNWSETNRREALERVKSGKETQEVFDNTWGERWNSLFTDSMIYLHWASVIAKEIK